MKVLLRLLLLPCFAGLSLLWSLPAQAEWFKDERALMGTRVTVELWGDERQPALDAIDAVFAEIARIEALMSPHIESSEVAGLNRMGVGSQRVSKELFALLQRAQEVSALSGGAFDVTIAAVGHLYDYRKGIAPDDKTLAVALESVSYRYIQLDPQHLEVRFTHPDTRIDLGGIAKGYAVARCRDLLQARGVQHALITAGGDSYFLGDHHGRPWMVAVKDPRAVQDNAVVIPLDNTAFSTSGDYERYFIRDGQRFHHILQPASGRSPGELQSVSIIGPDAVMTDALSTTVFVLGLEKGMALIESLPGYDAIIVDAARKLHYSSELMPAVR